MDESMDDNEDSLHQTSSFASGKRYVAVGILLVVNLLNYMDRFTIAGVLPLLQKHFDMNDQQSGMLQTVFIVFYMLFAPVCGYLGDRYNRKMIMACGLSVWISAVLISSFISRDNFKYFLLFRGVVGIGEASYSTIAPTIIADTFTGSARSTVLMIFYFAIPVGSGLGYIGGSYVSLWTDSWQWGVRFTPLLGVVCLLLIIFVLDEPIRGQAEHASLERSSVKEDLIYLTKVKTFRMTTCGFTCVVFAVGALSWWTPSLIGYAYAIQHGEQIVPKDQLAQVSLIFGLITCAAGIVGVVVGSTVAKALRHGYWGLNATHRADTLVCAFGSLLSLPFMYVCLVAATYHINVAWVLMFCAVTCMCLNWAVNMDILMNVIVANRRATATAIQTMISHLFGDASSPYIVGLISDSIRGDRSDVLGKFIALRSALFIPCFLLIGSAAFYLKSSFSVVEDQKKALHYMHVDTWDEAEERDGDDVETLISNVRRDSGENVEEGQQT